MANITISVQSFLNSANNLSIIIDDAQTVSQLKTAINSAEGTPTAIMDLFLNGTKLNDATTLTASGLISSSYIKTSNNLTEVGRWTKQERQDYKLQLAALRRAATGRRQFYDITQLPTQYTGNNVTDNANSGGLVVGRPWTSSPPYSAGLYRSQYSGWPNQNTANPTWFDGKTATATSVSSDFSLTLTAGETSRAYQWLGYILPDFTGTWTFTTSGVTIDDCLTIWIGASALSGYTTGNAVANISLASGSGTISLTSGTYYPIRVQYANNSGPGTNHLRWSRNGSPASTNFAGLVFYNSSTNGF